MFTQIKYTKADNTIVSAVNDDGQAVSIPCIDGNRDWEKIKAGGITPADFVGPSLTDQKKVKIAIAWDTCTAKCEAATISVATSAGTYTYGIDANSRDNIQSVMIGVLAGITPNPRPWTPKGSNAAISVTYADIGAIAGALGAAYDAMIQRYFAHKEAIKALTTSADVASYDVTTGWPS